MRVCRAPCCCPFSRVPSCCCSAGSRSYAPPPRSTPRSPPSACTAPWTPLSSAAWCPGPRSRSGSGCSLRRGPPWWSSRCSRWACSLPTSCSSSVRWADPNRSTAAASAHSATPGSPRSRCGATSAWSSRRGWPWRRGCAAPDSCPPCSTTCRPGPGSLQQRCPSLSPSSSRTAHPELRPPRSRRSTPRVSTCGTPYPPPRCSPRTVTSCCCRRRVPPELTCSSSSPRGAAPAAAWDRWCPSGTRSSRRWWSEPCSPVGRPPSMRG